LKQILREKDEEKEVTRVEKKFERKKVGKEREGKWRGGAVTANTPPPPRLVCLKPLLAA